MMLKQLMKMISNTRDDEIDCKEVYDVIDVYAEAVARGEDASAILPLVKHHLAMCAPCLEEYEALMRVIEQGAES